MEKKGLNRKSDTPPTEVDIIIAKASHKSEEEALYLTQMKGGSTVWQPN
jgi:hypothetical protein